MSRYGVVGATTRDLLTYRGAVIVHDNRSELEFLLPGQRVVRLSDGDLGQPVIRLRDHPDCQHIRFPLRRGDFR